MMKFRRSVKTILQNNTVVLYIEYNPYITHGWN